MALIGLATILGRASWVRERAGLIGAEPPYSTRQICSSVFPDIAVSGTKLPNGVLEMAEVGPGGRRALWYGRGLPHPVQRVALAHGLHHLIDRVEGMWECNAELRQIERARKMEPDPIEAACDLFAGELLVPFQELDARAPDDLFPDGEGIEAWEDICDGLSSTFNVPRDFILWRLEDLALLRQTHFFLK